MYENAQNCSLLKTCIITTIRQTKIKKMYFKIMRIILNNKQTYYKIVDKIF